MSSHPNPGKIPLLGLKRVCPICAKRFLFCENCWRGHKYCSPKCSRKGRKLNRRATERKYAATEKGRESRRRRQKNFRIRNILGHRVTDRSPRAPHLTIKPQISIGSDEGSRCCRCQKHIDVIFGGEFENPEEAHYFSFVRFRSCTDESSL